MSKGESFRDRLRAPVNKIKDASAGTTGRDDRLGDFTRQTLEKGQGAKEAVVQKGAQFNEAVGSQTSKLSLEEYRKELDLTIEQAFTVIAAQRVEIEALKERLSILEQQR